MNQAVMSSELANEITEFVQGQSCLHLASLTPEGEPYASYAPFALCEVGFYVQLSDIAIHARNLKVHPQASVLVIEDEKTSEELFARKRVSYRVEAQWLEYNSLAWEMGVEALSQRVGKLARHLSKMDDFNLFKLHILSGRFVKGFGKAYQFTGGGLAGRRLDHLRDGHKVRA